MRRARSTCAPAQRAPSATARWEALGSTVVLRVTDPLWLPRASAILARELDAIDRACSRFREDSDLTRVNVHAGGRPVPVAPLLVEALQVALRAAQLTDGDVDPTVGAALVLAGYDRDFSLLAQRQEPVEVPSPPTLIARRLSGHHTVELDAGRCTVRIPSGIVLDLGATAKAWAADRGARAVWEAAGCGVLVGLGGDIATAGPATAGGWRIHVTDDHRSGPDAPGQTVAIADGGLATSSVAVRRWQQGGQTMHHIIDPSSGAPAHGPWRTVSVAAADCTDANIAATAALVRGRRAPAWLDALGLPARLVAHDGAVLRIGDWPLEHSALRPRPDCTGTTGLSDRTGTTGPSDRTSSALPPAATSASVVGHGSPTPGRADAAMRRVDDLS
ncbi:MAG: FAD:protein FMN transferase [Solirubrobacteraceae bacterium]